MLLLLLLVLLLVLLVFDDDDDNVDARGVRTTEMEFVGKSDIGWVPYYWYSTSTSTTGIGYGWNNGIRYGWNKVRYKVRYSVCTVSEL